MVVLGFVLTVIGIITVVVGGIRFLNRNTRPSGRTTSTARSHTAGGATSTSANPAAPRFRVLPTRARRHFESVTADRPLARQNAARVIPLLPYFRNSSRRSLSAYRLRPGFSVFTICVLMSAL